MLPTNAVLLAATATVELPMNTVLVLTKTLAPTVTLAEAETVVAETLPAKLPDTAVATTLPTNDVLLADMATVELPMVKPVVEMSTLAPTVTLAEAATAVAETLPVKLPVIVVAATLPVKLPVIAVATTLPTNAVEFAETFTVELPKIVMLEPVMRTFAVELPIARALVLTKTLAPTVTFAVALTVVDTILPTNDVLLADTATVELPTVRLVLVVMTSVDMLAEAVIRVADTLPV